MRGPSRAADAEAAALLDFDRLAELVRAEVGRLEPPPIPGLVVQQGSARPARDRSSARSPTTARRRGGHAPAACGALVIV